MKHLLLVCICTIALLDFCYSQSMNPGKIYIYETNEPIILDGDMTEAAWTKGQHARDFWQYFPTDSAFAKGHTEIYMTYDSENIYVAVKCFSNGNDYITPSLKRDYSFFGNDNISILFDTFNDQNNAFLFGFNPFGVRREALIANGGRQRGDFTASWDNRWFGEAKVHDGFWVGEFAIPFKTLRFKEGSTQWRFNAYRNDTQTNELSTWANIPQNQIIMDLSYMGEIIWDKPLQKSGTNISVIPYAIAGMTRDFEEEPNGSPNFTRNIGGDAKVAVTSGLNLDLTINPDFSQVEVDAQVTNLSRFELFFPERRQFFLENADLFGSFGLTRVNPFFSRRIGVAQDTATGQNIQNPILYGARLSGKLTDRFRVGLLNMQTAAELENGLPSFNYTVAAAQQQVFERSNIAFIGINKQAMTSEPNNGLYNDYNRVFGIEYRLASPASKWTGKTFYHQAVTPEVADDKFTHGFQLQYLVRRVRAEWAHLFVGNGFNAEVGFIPRKDFLLVSPELEVFFYPKSGIINRHSINIDFRNIYKVGADGDDLLPRFGLSDTQFEASWNFSFKDNSRGELGMEYNNIVLFNDFDPTLQQADSVFLERGTWHEYTSFSASYRSDSRKKFFYNIAPNVGQFFNGTRAGVRGSFGYRYQPYGSIALSYNYNYIKLAEPFVPTNLWLVGPRIDFTFNKKLFLTTFIQYNSQLDNLNINARLQWRYQPVSDIFLVYTDNYLIDQFSQFSVRNRAIVLKITYWLNV